MSAQFGGQCRADVPALVAKKGRTKNLDAYNLDHLSHPSLHTQGALAGSDAVNNPVRAAVFRTHASIVKSSIKISVVVLLACVALLPWRAGVMFAVATALGMSYSAPILPGGRSPRSLPFAKGPFCAVVSTVVTILVPAAALGAPAGRTAALVIHTALRSLAYEILQDLPDIEGDAQDGTLTLPVAIGGHASCAVIGALAVACGAAANRAGTTGLHVVPASFLGLVATYVSNPKQYNRVAFKWLSYIPVAVFVSLAVEAVLGTDAFVGRAADPIYFHLF